METAQKGELQDLQDPAVETLSECRTSGERWILESLPASSGERWAAAQGGTSRRGGVGSRVSRWGTVAAAGGGK